MTPALDLLKKHRAEHRVHSYEHDPKSASYGLEAAEKLGLDPQQVFKTLLASSEKGELLVAVVPVVGTLDLKALAHAAGVKKCEMADPAAAQRAKELYEVFCNADIFLTVGGSGGIGEAVAAVLAEHTQGKFAGIGRG